MNKNLKLFKRITCILGITFLVMGMVPFGKVEQSAPEFAVAGIKTGLSDQPPSCEDNDDCDPDAYCKKDQCHKLNCKADENIEDHACVANDVEGCTDPEANNYNPAATVNDDSCTYDDPGGGGD